MYASLIRAAAPTVTRITSNMTKGATLQVVVNELERFGPLNLAYKWDNVGLLIEPYKTRLIHKILLTNDLTEHVMQEAIKKETDMIISYHPPIFAPLKRIRQGNWKERIVSMCLAESIALYSPHTTWDAIPGGVNDWLASSLNYTNIRPIEPNPQGAEYGGAGRIFETHTTLSNAVASVQRHIGLNVHLALGVKHNLDTPIRTVAVCAGSGGALLKGVLADLFITGEMSHHDVLDVNHQNTSVILCNHSNSERGFLAKFKPKLFDMLKGDCEVLVAELDEDPIKTLVMNL